MVLWPGRKLHWSSSSFNSTISRHFLSRYLAYTFPGKLRIDIPLWFVHCLLSPFLNIGIITPVCQSLWELCHTSTQLETLALTWEYLLQSALSTSPVWFHLHQQLFQILSLLLPLPLLLQWKLPLPLNVSLPVCHESVPLQDSKDLRSILSIVKGFHSHPLECYLQNSWRSRWHWIFCHENGGWSAKVLCFPKNSWNLTNNQALTMTFPWIFTLPKLPLSVYRDCKSDDDLSSSKAFNESFFAQIASLTSWFHQGVLFSLWPATISRFRPQLSAADEIIADLNSSHSVWMFSDASGSCLNSDDVTGCKLFPYFFVLQSQPFDPVSHKRPVGFVFGQGFESRKEHSTIWWSVDNSAPRFTRTCMSRIIILNAWVIIICWFLTCTWLLI